jgi:hypothetical protein
MQTLFYYNHENPLRSKNPHCFLHRVSWFSGNTDAVSQCFQMDNA